MGRAGGGLLLTLYSPDGWARARGSVPRGGEQRCQEMFIPQDVEWSGKLHVGEQLPSLLFRRRHSLPSLPSFSSNPAFPLGAVGNKDGEL